MPRPDALTAPRDKPAITVETQPLAQNQFLPVRLADGATARDIQIELRRGPTTVIVNWPVHEAAACAAWLREWLR